jgi:hypothetical protein
MAVTPLPYADRAVREVKYALDQLGAVGVGVMTNHEGIYPGDETFADFWKYLAGRGGREIVFVHPTDPVIRVEGSEKVPATSTRGNLVSSNPGKILHSCMLQA